MGITPVRIYLRFTVQELPRKGSCSFVSSRTRNIHHRCTIFPIKSPYNQKWSNQLSCWPWPALPSPVLWREKRPLPAHGSTGPRQPPPRQLALPPLPPPLPLPLPALHGPTGPPPLFPPPPLPPPPQRLRGPTGPPPRQPLPPPPPLPGPTGPPPRRPPPPPPQLLPGQTG